MRIQNSYVSSFLGNGAAMRVHPIGLLSHNASNTSIIENVKKSAKVTHTHMDAINGAVLQAACVSWALQGMAIPVVEFSRKGYKIRFLAKNQC